MFNRVFSILLFLTVLLWCWLLPAANERHVIKNPKPNMFEKNYIELVKVKTLNSDLGNGNYLFKPFTATTDGKNIYVYDSLQAKIFKLDKDLNFIKSYGRKGVGPGEFGGTGRSYPVIVKFGRNGLLYAFDRRKNKLIVLDKDLKYLKEIKTPIQSPADFVVNNKGKAYYITLGGEKHDKIGLYDNQKNLQISLDECETCFDFLLKRPQFKIYKKYAHNVLIGTLLMDITRDSRLLVYYKNSSTLAVINNNKIISKKHLRPSDALSRYAFDLGKIQERNKNGFINLFTRILIDDDKRDVFYLAYGIDNKEQRTYLYSFSTKGDLLDVFYITIKDPNVFIRVTVKVNDLFYAIEDSNITIYQKKEEAR